MSEALRVGLIGATGMVGRAVIEASIGLDDTRLTALARRETELPVGAKLDLIVAPPTNWDMILSDLSLEVIICALGTTIAQEDGDREAFRAVDYILVVDSLRAARAGGAKRCIVVSAIGSNARSRVAYSRIKGEMEAAVSKLGFERLDILQPGLLRGVRRGRTRLGESVAMGASPLTDLLLHGRWRKLRSISAENVARAALTLSARHAAGTFYHEHDSLMRHAQMFGRESGAKTAKEKSS